MKEKRIVELNNLETCLNRVKMQKIQMHEMFSSLMDKMNTLKFTDIMTLKASSDAMVKEVDDIRSGLEDLEKGLIEVEKYQKI
jgi:dihydroorotate dehydrogenase